MSCCEERTLAFMWKLVPYTLQSHNANMLVWSGYHTFTYINSKSEVYLLCTNNKVSQNHITAQSLCVVYMTLQLFSLPLFSFKLHIMNYMKCMTEFE